MSRRLDSGRSIQSAVGGVIASDRTAAVILTDLRRGLGGDLLIAGFAAIDAMMVAQYNHGLNCRALIRIAASRRSNRPDITVPTR
jgi:hypothetical protein